MVTALTTGGVSSVVTQSLETAADVSPTRSAARTETHRR
eukprot:CAMPEP_0119366790 /NCGR_PEP_ID=MMETSP1334-20130426/13621_1 /TAXON_ID=127549 /ORGANISM="Calcidiscus leptoporus, Strain RCC1130" /LENGTH=38 /DNA_ID= /DNA_START= /DNA_END= /DNA_ORIENTATION=